MSTISSSSPNIAISFHYFSNALDVSKPNKCEHEPQFNVSVLNKTQTNTHSHTHSPTKSWSRMVMAKQTYAGWYFPPLIFLLLIAQNKRMNGKRNEMKWNEWTTEWMDDWMTEWMNHCTIELYSICEPTVVSWTYASMSSISVCSCITETVVKTLSKSR